VLENWSQEILQKEVGQTTAHFLILQRIAYWLRPGLWGTIKQFHLGQMFFPSIEWISVGVPICPLCLFVFLCAYAQFPHLECEDDNKHYVGVLREFREIMYVDVLWKLNIKQCTDVLLLQFFSLECGLNRMSCLENMDENREKYSLMDNQISVNLQKRTLIV
jgi:hypothetical protein